MRINKNYKLLFWGILALFALPAAALIFFDEAPGHLTNSLVINEIVASNGTGLIDEDGDFSDWLEIYNPTEQPVNLSGWSLTDDPAQPQKWSFPDMTLPADAYLVVFASGKNRANPTGPLHTNFKLSKGGEFLGLYNLHDSRFVSTISPQFPRQIRDVAYGQAENLADGRKKYLPVPSPGEPNNTDMAMESIAATVEFTPTRGFFDAPFYVELNSNTPDAVIRYTLDGTDPTQTKGQLYTGSISVDRTAVIRAAAFKDTVLPSPINTHSYIFPDNVINQPANPPGWPNTWGVYLDYRPYLPEKGAPVPADYEMDPRITQSDDYKKTIADDLKSIPSISLVTSPQNLDIYINALERGQAWERPVSLEWIAPDNPATEFQINAGIRMQGVSARWEFMPKKSFRLFFKGQYGLSKLKAPIFPDSSVDEFNTLVLRGGANRGYAGYPDAVDYTQVTYTRDEWMRASQIAMSGVGSHGRFVHLYLNGLYWGLYNLVERPDAEFAASYYGGKPENWFAIKHGGTILNPDEVAQGADAQIKIGEEISGSNHRYEELLHMLDEGNLADPDKYNAIKQYVDTAQFIDYIILNLYAGNNDWGDNNWFVALQNDPPGLLRYFMWDGEVTWNEGARLYLGKSTPHHKMRVLFLELMKNPDFKMGFADRLYKNLFNNGPLTDENSQARWMRINNQVDRAIVTESARWGDVRYTDNPIDHEDWKRARDAVLAQMDGNAAKLVALTRQAGYYPPINPPEINHAGGVVNPGFKLEITQSPTLSAEEGDIFYTTNGADPRKAVTGKVTQKAQLYTAPLQITQTVGLKVRILSNGIWSSLREIDFYVDVPHRRLQLTKIMYNPAAAGGDDEFIELTNIGDAPVNLSGMRFEGISFAFAPNTPLLPPGEKIVLARNYQAFETRYPGVPVLGIFEGQLSNRGETIRLMDSEGNTVTSVSYNDENGWPISPDGQGDFLELVNLNGDPNDPGNWRAGNGIPGIEEFTAP